MAKLNPSGAPSRWARLSKNLAFWVVLLIVPFALITVIGPGRKDVKLFNYTQFKDELEAGNIRKVTVIDGELLSGEFNQAVLHEEQSTEEFTTRLPGPITQELLDELEAQNVTIVAEKARPNWLGLLAGALPWLFLFGLMLFWLRQMQAGGTRAFSFGKSRAKLISADAPGLTFADVAGVEEAKEELQETIEFLKDPSKFTRLGGRLPRGALLVGPPGTGKTLLARAVAGEASRPFFSMSGSDFVEMFVGVGASRVRDLFEQGKANAPCIIFIDEIDAVGRHRGAGLGGGHDEREQTLNQLLVEMDGFEPNDGVILIAATNRPDVLDPALLRPGRFDRQIVVDAPDIKGREAILAVHTRKIPLASDVDLGVLARGTPGMSGADLANLVNEAALLAARKDKDRVYMEDFEEAKDKVLLGAERKSMVISDEEKKLSAYHEAGHALAAYMTPECDPLHKVTIVPRGRALGLTFSVPVDDRHSYSKAYLEAQLVYAYGGRVAEELVFGVENITTGAGNDIERATALARRMITEWGMSDKLGPQSIGERTAQVFLGREIAERHEISEDTARMVDEEVRSILDQAYQKAKKILSEHMDKLGALATALLERETLDATEIYAIFDGKALPPPRAGDEASASDVDSEGKKPSEELATVHGDGDGHHGGQRAPEEVSEESAEEEMEPGASK